MMDYFWRVTDETSVAQYCPGEGFIAGHPSSTVTLVPSSSKELKKAKTYIERHLNWRNTSPTPFVSVYTDRKTAENGAQRRVRDGKENVIMWMIKVHEDDDGVEWDTVRALKRDLDFLIEEEALHNAEHEALFVSCIPRHCVVRGKRLTDRRGRKFLYTRP
jgi:ribosomal protein L16/L10AE